MAEAKKEGLDLLTRLRIRELILMGLLLIAAVMANLPEEYIEDTLGVNRGALVACLGIAVIIGLFLYLKTGLFIAVVLLIAGANMPDQIAEGPEHLEDPDPARAGRAGRRRASSTTWSSWCRRASSRGPRKRAPRGPGALLRHREEQPGVRAEGAGDELRPQPAPRQRLHPARLCRDARQRADDRAPAAQRRRPRPDHRGRRQPGGARAALRPCRGGRSPQGRAARRRASSPPRRPRPPPRRPSAPKYCILFQ